MVRVLGGSCFWFSDFWCSCFVVVGVGLVFVVSCFLVLWCSEFPVPMLVLFWFLASGFLVSDF